MTDLERLAGLAMRVEGLTGADVLVDDAISWALSDWENLGGFWRRHKATGEREQFQWRPSPAYTASLDSAMTLVPETCLAILKQLWASGGKREWYAIIQQYHDGMWVDQEDALHPSAAIALTAASLKALASKSREVG